MVAHMTQASRKKACFAFQAQVSAFKNFVLSTRLVSDCTHESAKLMRCAGQKPNLLEEDVHNVAGLLMLFFRQLPEPLIPFVHFDVFVGLGRNLLQFVFTRAQCFRQRREALKQRSRTRAESAAAWQLRCTPRALSSKCSIARTIDSCSSFVKSRIAKSSRK
jgi:hypothetical protein